MNTKRLTNKKDRYFIPHSRSQINANPTLPNTMINKIVFPLIKIDYVLELIGL